MKELTPLEKANRTLCLMTGHIPVLQEGYGELTICSRCGKALTDILGNETDKQGE